MQQLVYKCDHCKKPIGAVPHVTIVMQTNHPGTGIAVPSSTTREAAVWRTTKFPSSFVHFHPKCMTPWAEAQVKAATPAKKK